MTTTQITLAVQASTQLPARTITGLILPLNTITNVSSAGTPVKFTEGALTWHPQLSRVKLCLEHDTTAVVGYAIAITPAHDGIHATFYLPAGEAGDAALREASEHLRDGLSVGVNVTTAAFDAEGTYVVTAAELTEVSLCHFPAFPDARTTIINLSTTERTTMDPTNRTPAPVADQPAPVADQPAPVADQPAPAAATFAQAPAFHTAPRVMTLSAVYEKIAMLAGSGANANQITAALADVIPGNDKGQGFLPPAYIGELWKASTAERPWIDASVVKNLSAIKMFAWAWNVLPQVGEYAGNKTEIPTNAPSTEPFEFTAERTAGGWDIDRIFIDLGDASIISALFDRATDDYRAKTNAKHRRAIAAKATSLTAAATLPAALTALGAAASKIGARVDAVGVASDVWAGLTMLKRDDVPWWMGSGDQINLGTASGMIGSTAFFNDPSLAATQVLAFDRRAVTWYEKSAQPIRAQAIDLAHGGVDIGVFGYHQSLISEPKAVWSINVGQKPAGA